MVVTAENERASPEIHWFPERELWNEVVGELLHDKVLLHSSREAIKQGLQIGIADIEHVGRDRRIQLQEQLKTLEENMIVIDLVDEHGELLDMDEDVKENFTKLWDSYFGREGFYRSSRGFEREEVQEGKKVLLKAFMIAYYGHRAIARDSGEKFVNHTIETAQIIADLRLPPETAAKALMHDLQEDTVDEAAFVSLVDGSYVTKKDEGYKVPYPYPVSIDDIDRLFDEKIANSCEKLTKVSKIQKRSDSDSKKYDGLTEKEATRLQLVETIVDEDLDVIVIKLADRLHNMRTIEWKSASSKLSNATETLITYAPLARRLGLEEIYNELTEISYSLIHYIVYAGERSENGEIDKDEHLASIRHALNEITILDPGFYHLKQNIVTSLFRFGDFSLDLSLPTLFDIAKEIGRRKATEGDAYALVQIGIEARRGEFGLEFIDANTANGIHSQLVDAPDNMGFRLIEGVDSGRDEATRDYLASVKKHFIEYDLVYTPPDTGFSYPIKLRVYRRSFLQRQQTPITYLNAVALTKKDRQNGMDLSVLKSRAHLKHAEVVKQLRLIEEKSEGNKKRFHDEIFMTLTDLDMVVVTGQKGEGENTEYKSIPLQQGATVMDYAVTVLPDSFHLLTDVKINGKSIYDPVTKRLDLAIQLQRDDLVHIIFSNTEENRVQVWWMDCATEVKLRLGEGEQTPREVIAMRLNEKRSDEGVRKALMKRGWEKIASRLPKYEGIQRIRLVVAGIFHSKVAADAVLLSGGLGRLNEEEIEEIASQIVDYWNNLEYVEIEVEDTRHMILAEIDAIIGRNKLNIVSHGDGTHGGSASNAILTYRFDLSEDVFKKTALKQAIIDIQASVPEVVKVSRIREGERR